MCITTTSKNLRRRSTTSQRSSSWSPSSMAKIIDSLDIDDLKDENDSSRSSTSTRPQHRTTTSGSCKRSKERKSSYKKKSKTISKKSVSFHKDVIVRNVLHKDEYTEEEASRSWYCAGEYSRIRKNLLSTLDLVWLDLFSESVDDESARGLENYTAKGKIKDIVRKRRQDAVWAVLDEQDAQVDQAEAKQLNYLVYDDKAIRDVYKKHTRPSTDVARSAGRKDAKQSSCYIAHRGAKNFNDEHEKDDDSTRSKRSHTRVRSIFHHAKKATTTPAPVLAQVATSAA